MMKNGGQNRFLRVVICMRVDAVQKGDEEQQQEKRVSIMFFFFLSFWEKEIYRRR